MTSTSKTKSPTRIYLDDLTLDELDEVNTLVEEKGAGFRAAVAYVRREAIGRPDLTLPEAGQLRGKDVVIIVEAQDDGPDPS